MAVTTKKPTPLSTYALAAFLTWKQFDLLLLVRQEQSSTAAVLSGHMEEIQAYDRRHGGTFYDSVSWDSVYSSLRTLERRQLVRRHAARNGLIEWTISPRGTDALNMLEQAIGAHV
jgi:hypothetical protein